MKLHANAALSLKGRRELCRRVVEGERTLTEAAGPLGQVTSRHATGDRRYRLHGAKQTPCQQPEPGAGARFRRGHRVRRGQERRGEQELPFGGA
jgi:hypothetical protein